MAKIKRKDRNLFEYQERMEKLSGVKTPLDKLNNIVEFEIFRPLLTEILASKEQKASGGVQEDAKSLPVSFPFIYRIHSSILKIYLIDYQDAAHP